MRVAAIQLDSVVGDLEGNAARILDAAVRAHADGAELAVTAELSLVGYPPRDILLREGFVAACERACDRLARELASRGAGELALIVGLPTAARRGPRPTANSVAILRNGIVERIYSKRLLPSYDVFDESRYFSAGDECVEIEVGSGRVGVLICEDLWRGDDVMEGGRYVADPLAETVARGAKVVVAPSASPFFALKHTRRLELLAQRARESGAAILSVNAVGSNDDFVFDGGSCLVDREGVIASAPRFREASLVIDTERASDRSTSAGSMAVEEELARAIMCAIEGYVRKSGHERVLLGLSGGIDSALVAALAVAAIGPAQVRGVSMPGPHSSHGSVHDAIECASLLGMKTPDSIPILDSYETLRTAVSRAELVEGLTDENLQSRLRGITLMTLSNATGALVLSTGNKSELAVGYATLYGDMCGGLAPLGDLLKGQVYAVARWINEHSSSLGLPRAPIPQASIDKPPSAELRPNQTDQDSLPPYDILDRIVSLFVDEERSSESIARELSLDLAVVNRWTSAIDRAHYKRFQAPIIPKLSARAFGPGRRLPLAMRFRAPAG